MQANQECALFIPVAPQLESKHLLLKPVAHSTPWSVWVSLLPEVRTVEHRRKAQPINGCWGLTSQISTKLRPQWWRQCILIRESRSWEILETFQIKSLTDCRLGSRLQCTTLRCLWKVQKMCHVPYRDARSRKCVGTIICCPSLNWMRVCIARCGYLSNRFENKNL